MFRPKTRSVALPSPRAGVGEEVDRLTCPKCDTSLEPARLTSALGVCYRCGYHFRLRAPERVAMLVEPGSFREEDQAIVAKDVLGFKDSQPYTKRIEQSRAATGANEAVIWGEAMRSEEHTSELQSQSNLVCRLLPAKKKTNTQCSHA